MPAPTANPGVFGGAGNLEMGDGMFGRTVTTIVIAAGLAALAGCAGERAGGTGPAELAAGADTPGLRSAVTAYTEGDYETAMRQFSALADGGDAKAQFALGLMHENGEGVEADAAAAAGWYRRSAEQG